MIQSRPYEFLTQHTPQKEWIEKRGILMLLAMFFIELGAGAFIVSSILGNQLGMLVSWLLCGVLGGGFHLAFLGHPTRFWRMFLSSGWKSSWISRGLIFVITFLGLGAIHMILFQAASPSTTLMVIADIFAFLTMIYVGFVMAYVNAIPLWNTPLLPVLYLVLGTWGGLGLSLITLNSTGDTANVEQLSRIFLLSFIFIVFVYLFSIRYQGTAGKTSVKTIVAGKLAPLFWVVVVLLGTALPAGVAVGSLIAGLAISPLLLFVLVILELLGDLTLRYCILKAGLYAPLIPASSYAT